MYTLSKFISIFSSSFFFFFFSRNQILPNSAKRIRTRTRNSENLRAYHRKRITTLVVFLTSETHRSASCIFKRHLDTPNSRPTSTLPPDSVQFLGANLRAGNPRETAVSLSFFLSFLSRNGKLEITTRRWSKSGGPESAGARLFRCSIFLACRRFPRRRSTAFTRARNPGVRLAKLPPWKEQDFSLLLSLEDGSVTLLPKPCVLCDRPPFASDFGGALSRYRVESRWDYKIRVWRVETVCKYVSLLWIMPRGISCQLKFVYKIQTESVGSV